MRAAFRAFVAPGTVVLFLAAQGDDRTLRGGWALLTAGSLAAVALGTLDLQRPLSTIEKFIAATLAAFALSAAFGLDPHRSLLLSVPMLASVLLWTLIVRERQPRFAALPVTIGLAIAAGVQSALLLRAALRNPQSTPPDWVIDAGAGWLIVPNDIAWMACALPLLASAWARRANAILCALLAPFLGLCALAHSRTAAVVAMATAVCFVALSIRWRHSWRIGRLWVVAAPAALLAVSALFAIASMHARLQLWAAAGSIFRDYPWTGVGIHDFVVVAAHYLPGQAELIDPRITPWPHNLILEIAAECGIIGIIPTAVVLGSLVRRAFALARAEPSATHRAMLAGLFGMVLLACVEASLLRQWVWLLGTALCALLVAERGPQMDGEKNHEQE